MLELNLKPLTGTTLLPVIVFTIVIFLRGRCQQQEDLFVSNYEAVNLCQDK